MHAGHVAAVVKLTLVLPERAQIVVAQVHLVVVAGHVQDGAVQVRQDFDELPVVFEVLGARLVLDDVAKLTTSSGFTS